jgi:outer membrane receptor protein involved in Fe transport
MARRLMILGALLLVMAPSIGLPQAGPAPTPIYTGPPPPAPGWNNAGMSTFPSAPGTGWGTGRRLYADEQWVLKGDVRFGHMWMNFNTFFPFASNPDPEQQVFAFERMDIQLKDGNFWAAFGGLELQPVPTLVLYGRYGHNIPRSGTMYMDASGRYTRPGIAIIDGGVIGALGNGANSISPWYWDTTFNWWMWETGGAWWFTPEFAFEAGFRYEHIDYLLQNPRGVTEAVAQGPPGLAITCDRI